MASAASPSEPQRPEKSMTKEEGGPTSPYQNLQRGLREFNEQDDMEMRSDAGITKPGLRSRKTHKGLGLLPRPSTSPEDPLNWKRWKKEVAFGSLMLGLATSCMLKSLLVTVNTVLSIELNSSYSGTTALTGLPLILGSLAGLKSQMLSQIIGKRGIYIGSAILMLLSSLWNMHIYTNYSTFMVARILQGIGWGMYESLVAGSIADMFFVHERDIRLHGYNVVNILFTWGTPIVGGYISQSSEGFGNQIMIINIIQAFSIVLLILATPETTFDRSNIPTPTAPKRSSAGSVTTITAVAPAQPSGFKAYASTLRLANQYSTQKFSAQRVLRPLRATCAPSALLTTLLTAPLVATSIAIASSVSLLFSAIPTFLFPSRLGYLFAGPLVWSLVTYSVGSFVLHVRTKPPNHLAGLEGKALANSIPGSVLGVVGLLAFGIYTFDGLLGGSDSTDGGMVFAIAMPADSFSFITVSALFGMLVGGSLLLSYSGSAYLASLPYARAGELVAAQTILTDIIAGIFVIGMPMWISTPGAVSVLGGLKTTSIALAVLSIVVCSTAGAVLWVKGNGIASLDERVLGKRDAAEMDDGMKGNQEWKSTDSFFEA